MYIMAWRLHENSIAMQLSGNAANFY